MDTFNETTIARARALDTLITTSEGVARAEDYGDMIGAVRLVERAADQARRAVVAEARAAGTTWQEIGDALGVTRQAAEARFGDHSRRRPAQQRDGARRTDPNMDPQDLVGMGKSYGLPQLMHEGYTGPTPTTPRG